MDWLVIGASVLLAVVHLTVGRIHFIEHIPRSRFLSIAGGISVAYVFLHILPELEEHQETVAQELTAGIFNYLAHHVYVTALLGLIIFYSVEKYVKKSHKANKEASGESSPLIEAFWNHVALFFFYNALIGYLLVYQSDDGWLGMLLFVIVMALHFLVTDFGLRFHHEETYDKYGRWVLSVAIIIGAAAGSFAIIPEEVFALVFAFLSGAIILNVLKEELPDERESSLGAFVSGAAGYIVLLQLLLL
ncbi:hypothetical protein MM300_14510 [Evansella sp. LMS18]|uniref:hypothetical protein n=1 Tax=Evansella sp. LMS18 TaxID=2924033 RepID=UPI0020D15A79|nr:hypothetical protein [Evansella sp. LMS18]UTR09110.1 hypothetical protein MM300_14510 [Evansella sp. LMS18]